MYSRINHTSLLITLALLTGSSCFVSKASQSTGPADVAERCAHAVSFKTAGIEVKDGYENWIKVTYNTDNTNATVTVAPWLKTNIATTVGFFGGLGYCYQNASIIRLLRNSCLQTIRSRDGLLYIAAAGAALGSWYRYHAIAAKQRELQSRLQSCLSHYTCGTERNADDYGIASNPTTGTFCVYDKTAYEQDNASRVKGITQQFMQEKGLVTRDYLTANYCTQEKLDKLQSESIDTKNLNAIVCGIWKIHTYLAQNPSVTVSAIENQKCTDLRKTIQLSPQELPSHLFEVTKALLISILTEREKSQPSTTQTIITPFSTTTTAPTSTTTSSSSSTTSTTTSSTTTSLIITK